MSDEETAKSELRYLPVDKLVGLRRNPQHMTPKQMDALKASMQRDGFLAPVLVRVHTEDGHWEVLSGNHRVMAARELGLEEVPALVVEVDDRQAGRIAVNLNTVHGDPTAELLAPYLAELDDETLATVHLEDSLISDLRRFDADLESTLAKMQIPASFDNETPRAGSIAQCVCPSCGRKHMRLGEATPPPPAPSAP